MNYATSNGKCSNCGKVAILHSTGECVWCTPMPTLVTECPSCFSPWSDTGCTGTCEKPTLANTDAERNGLLYGGRRTELLKESKTFDSERLNTSPLFAPHTPKLF